MKMIDYNLLKGKITAMQSTEPEYAFNFLNNAQNPSTEWECIEDMLDSMEVYEAEPVKRGRWIKQEGFWNKNTVKCSLCGNYLDMNGVNGGRSDANFCPYCGARMDGDTDNNVRNLTDEETAIYESWIESEAKDTGENIMDGEQK